MGERANTKLMGERRDFVQQVAMMQHRAGQLGLFRTMHKLHDANREAGFELSGIIGAAMSAARQAGKE